jgi:hypothetical protein
MDVGFSIGRMGVVIKGSFIMGSSMVKEFILIRKGKREEGYGKKENDSKRIRTRLKIDLTN